MAQARAWLGLNEFDGSFRKVIDIYNTIRPLPRGYKVKYTDDWCATFISAVGVACGMSEILLPECGCEWMTRLYKKIGRWEECDAYIPQPGDLLLYDWQDTGEGDCTGWADHVGIVERVDREANEIHIIEGNRGRSVRRTVIGIDSRYIRGFCLPAYEGEGGAENTEKENEEVLEMGYKIEFETKDAAERFAAKLKGEGYACYVSGEAEAGSTAPARLATGDAVRLLPEAKIYGTNNRFAQFIYTGTMFVLDAKTDRVLFSTSKNGKLTGAVDAKYLVKV